LQTIFPTASPGNLSLNVVEDMYFPADLRQARMNSLAGRIHHVNHSNHTALWDGLDREGTETVELPIPNEYIGAIMGQRGSKITEIRYESNSKIMIRDSKVDGEKSIHITGTNASIQMAKAMIKQCIMVQNQAYSTRESHYLETGTEDDDAIETVVMDIPREKVRALIGPYGTRITKIRNESRVKIHIQDREGAGEQTISVTGSKANIEKAEVMIKMYTDGTEDTDAIETVKMDIPSEKVKALIGPHGATITKIRKESMARIHIQDCVVAGEQTITVTGSKANIEKAEYMIKMYTV